jgi:hypothetical protein
MQAINGIQFWDFTNPLAPALLKYMTLPGIAESDYESGNWWTFWQAPYVYVGGSGNGVYVIDAKDPRNPVLVKQVATSTWGGFRVGPTFAVGNLMVLVGNDVQGLVTMDISDPVNPKLIKTLNTAAKAYSGILNGDRIITAGSDNQRLNVYDISNPSNITLTAQSPDIGGRVAICRCKMVFPMRDFPINTPRSTCPQGLLPVQALPTLPAEMKTSAWYLATWYWWATTMATAAHWFRTKLRQIPRGHRST